MERMAGNVMTKRVYMSMVDVVGAMGRRKVKWGGQSATVCERKEERGE